MSPVAERNCLLHSASCVASVIAEADGSLRLDGQVGVLAPDIVERNEVLSNIAANATVGEEVCLPISRYMASLWLNGVAFAEGDQALHQLGESSRTLSQTLLAADAMADMDTVNKLCKSQRTRIRVAASKAKRSVGHPTTPPPVRHHIQRKSAALWSRLCCGRPDEGADGTSAETLHTPFTEAQATSVTEAQATSVACGAAGSASNHDTLATPRQHSQNSTADSLRLELPMPLPARPGGVAFVGGGDSDGINDTDGNHIFAVNPLTWLEQVFSDVSPDLAQKLMHEAFKPATGLQQLQPLLAGLPAWLQALTYHACTPFVDTHGEFDATIMKPEEAAFAADILPNLATVTAVKLHIHNPGSSTEDAPRKPQELDMAPKHLLLAAFSPSHLKNLHISFRNRSLAATHAAAIASKLTQTSTLEALQIRADGCTDRVRIQGTFFAQAVCVPPHLTRLDLRGKGLINDHAGTLAAHMPKLVALRELHIDDSSLSHKHAAALVHAAAALRDLTSLYFGGITCSIAGQTNQLGMCAQELVSTACMLTQLRSLSVCEDSVLASGWCGIGRAMEQLPACCAQLTHLALVRSVRCEDMLGVGRALTCMPHLRSFKIVTFCHDKPPLCTASAHSNVNLHPCVPAVHHLLPGLSSATMLRELALAGLIVTPHQAGLLATVLIQLSGLQSLTLSDASPSGHSLGLGLAASALANVKATAEHFRALRELCLHTSNADQVLSTAIGALPSLTSLSFSMWHSRVTTPEVARGLRGLGGLRRLHLRISIILTKDLRVLARALQHLGQLTELRLQFDWLNKHLMQQVGQALVVPGASSVAEALTLSPRLSGDGSPGLLNLRLLDVSQCVLADDPELDVWLLSPAVTSMPQLEEVVVSPRLWVHGLPSTWGVRVTVKTCSGRAPTDAF